MDVVDALNQSLNNIAFPSGQAHILQIKEDFLKVSNFSNVFGAIDGTLIPIIGMSEDDEHVFVFRKGFHAINMQGIVTAVLKFTNIVCKYGGATHDAFILANSSIPEVMDQLPGGGWLLGDSGYPLRPWLMTPILAPQTRQEEKFNESHIKTRNCVERVFGKSLIYFRCLHKTGGALAYTPATCVRIIECCCRLHNRAIEEKLPIPLAGQVAIYFNNHTVNTQNIASAVNIRNIIVRRF
ncbi:putative nuclease HARBI1 [Saccostrea cucullata]|uniref:putative nuclease HARBI1 n=1 Tax=Saccostrea cuccullata TaxID=36930 RepID=UPI002ED1CEA1